jgi:hypothetical protein
MSFCRTKNDTVKIQQMIADVWDGPRRGESTVRNPSWELVERAIRQLDANRHTCLSLLGENNHELVVGGGNGHFVLIANLDEDTHLTALDEDKPKEEIELTVGGQTGVYTAQMIWDEETALRVVSIFYQLNRLDPLLTWSAP